MDIFDLSRADIWISLPALVVMLGGILLGLYQLRLPKALPEDVPPEDFSAGRAFRHLQIIAREPHPAGTPAHRAVGDYLLAELTKLGLECQVQEATAVNNMWGAPYPCGRARNVLARLPGASSSPKILISAHYDSVPGSPGATDNGSAVAALLETARALKTGVTLHNDIVFLFADGEEVGILGAHCFVERHPWAKEVGLVINFDARGTRGPVLMYETSQGNRGLIKEFGRAVPYPVATSFSYEVSRRLPNYTDFDVYKKTGWPGLNFACVGKLVHYHTALDSLDNHDLNLLQHQGSYALSLLRHFGNLDLAQLKGGNSTYFNPFRKILWSYSEKWNLPLSLLAVLGYIGSVAAGFSLNLLYLANLALGFGAFLGGTLATVAVIFGLWKIILRLDPQYRMLKTGDTYNSRYYIVSFVLLALANSGSLFGWFVGNGGWVNFWAGAMLGWVILLGTLSILFPSASYIVTWPLILNLAGLDLLYLTHNSAPALFLFLYGALAMLSLLLLAPIISLFFDALGLGLAWVVIAMVSFTAGLLAPYTLLLAGPFNWPLTIVLVLAGLGMLGTGIVSSSFNARQPRPTGIFYGLDADSGAAAWATTDHRPDEWTGQFFGGETELEKYPDFFLSTRLSNSKVLQGKAPQVELALPEIEILEDVVEREERTLRMQIRSGRNAPVMTVFMDLGTNPALLSASVDGLPLTTPPGNKPPDRWGLRFWALPEEGFELELKVANSGPLTLRVIDQSFGLPAFADFQIKPRPHHLMPPVYQGFIADSTLLKKTFSFL